MLQDNSIIVIAKRNNKKILEHSLPSTSRTDENYIVIMHLSKNKLFLLQLKSHLTKRSQYVNRSIILKTFTISPGRNFNAYYFLNF